MVRILADNIDELYMVENWLECGILNTPVLNEVTYPGREVEVSYEINTTRPHAVLRDNTWNQVAAIAYVDGDAEVELVKPFREMEGVTVENGVVILPPPEPIEFTTGDEESTTEESTEEVTEEKPEETTNDSGEV